MKENKSSQEVKAVSHLTYQFRLDCLLDKEEKVKLPQLDLAMVNQAKFYFSLFNQLFFQPAETKARIKNNHFRQISYCQQYGLNTKTANSLIHEAEDKVKLHQENMAFYLKEKEQKLKEVVKAQKKLMKKLKSLNDTLLSQETRLAKEVHLRKNKTWQTCLQENYQQRKAIKSSLYSLNRKEERLKKQIKRWQSPIITFGQKDNQRKLSKGKLTLQDWRRLRHHQWFSLGESSAKLGNKSIRIKENPKTQQLELKIQTDYDSERQKSIYTHFKIALNTTCPHVQKLKKYLHEQTLFGIPLYDLFFNADRFIANYAKYNKKQELKNFTEHLKRQIRIVKRKTKNREKYYVQITFDVLQLEKLKNLLPSTEGVKEKAFDFEEIGLDLNEGMIAFSALDKQGNLTQGKRVFLCNDKNQRQQTYSSQQIEESLKGQLRYFVEKGKQIVIEDLAFHQKKRKLIKGAKNDYLKAYNFMLSSFPYRKFERLLTILIAKMPREEKPKLFKVNPAFTSQKALELGLDRHIGAAEIIRLRKGEEIKKA